MPRYAVDFLADIEVLKFSDSLGPAGNCRETSCQTDKVNKNAYQTGMGNAQCLVSCTDQALERKVLVSRGTQCSKIKYHTRIAYNTKKSSESANLTQVAKVADLPVVSTRPCVSGVNLQTIKDGIRQESTQNNGSPIEQSYLKRKRDILLGNLQLIENGEEADIDSLSDTLSNVDVKVELQRHLSESYQQRMQDYPDEENKTPAPKEEVHQGASFEVENVKQLPIESQSHERGDMYYDQVPTSCNHLNEIPGPYVPYSKPKYYISKLPVHDKRSSTRQDDHNETQPNVDCNLHVHATCMGDRRNISSGQMNMYHQTKPLVEGRPYQLSQEYPKEFVPERPIKSHFNNYKSCAGDMGDNQATSERPPVYPALRPPTPVHRSRSVEQREILANENRVNQYQYPPHFNSNPVAHNRATSEIPSSMHRHHSLPLKSNDIHPGHHQIQMLNQKSNLQKAPDHSRTLSEHKTTKTTYPHRVNEPNVVNSPPPLGKSQFIRGKTVSQRFYIPESANIEKILSDQSDRRIKAICDRNHCDIEVYSRAPRSGFMKNVMVLTAPSQEALKKCVRSLDCSFKWCISSQLK